MSEDYYLEEAYPEELIPVVTIAHDFNKKTRSLDVTVEGKESDIEFSDLSLTEDILNGLKRCGFQKPSPIQLRAIPLGRLGFDLLLQAKSGTGKTCVFSVIGLEKVAVAEKCIQVLILVPSREIAIQNANVLKNIGIGREGLRVKAFIGGKPMDKESRRVRSCHVAVGTPGRVAHLIREYNMDLSKLRVFVLDEADKLLDASFYTDLKEAFDASHPGKQIIAASATYPNILDEFILRFMKNPLKVQLDVSAPVLLAISQFALDVKEMHNYNCVNALSLEDALKLKLRCLEEILLGIEFTQAIIFTVYQTRAERIYTEIREWGVDVVLLSGALDQASRLDSLAQFQQRKCRIMVATDLAARGLDCESVDLVINFECPTDLPTYIHRMGRAGRFGAQGAVFTFMFYSIEWNTIERFKNQVNIQITTIRDHDTLEKMAAASFSSLASDDLLELNDNDECTAGTGTPVAKGKNEVNSPDVWAFCQKASKIVGLSAIVFNGIHILSDLNVIEQNTMEMWNICNTFEEMYQKLNGKSAEVIENEVLAMLDISGGKADKLVEIETSSGLEHNTEKLAVPAEELMPTKSSKLTFNGEASVSAQVNGGAQNLSTSDAKIVEAVTTGSAVGLNSKDKFTVENIGMKVLSRGLRGRGRGLFSRTTHRAVAAAAEDPDSSSVDEGSDSD